MLSKTGKVFGVLLVFFALAFAPGVTQGQGSSSAITASFDTMWIDYDVTEDGQLGMRMHIRFTVQNMRAINGNVAYGFETEDGNRLYTPSEAYRSTNGQLTIYKSITPAYDDTYYDDLQIFFPYSELTAHEGANNLRVHVDILYGSESDVHLTYYDFTFTRTF